MKPLILINFKTYQESTGERGILLAQRIAKVKSTRFDIAIAPSTLLLQKITSCIKKPIYIYAQHVDSAGYGAHTGHVLPADVRKMGARGTILNHSEKKLTFTKLKETVGVCKIVGLNVVICASTLEEIRKVAVLEPEYVAYEPWALIGGNVSVTNAKPEVISEAVKIVQKISPKTRLLCGAGVHGREDLRAALRLGAVGVLLAHAVVEAKDSKRFLEEMMR